MVGLVFSPFGSFLHVMKSLQSIQRFFVVITLGILVLPTPLSAHTNEAIAIVLDQAQLTCDQHQAHIELSWDSVGPLEHFAVSRKFSWKEGWETVEKDTTEQTLEDAPHYVEARTYVYRVTSVLSGKEYVSNNVRIDVAPCFSQVEEKPAPITLTSREFPRAIPQNLWGATVGYSSEDMTAFEELVGKTMTTSSAEVFWGNENEFPVDLAEAFADKTMVLFWNPGDYNSEAVDDPKFSYKSILSGEWDTYITTFAKQVKEYGKPVILVPFPEMNGDWYTWGGTVNGNTAESHIAAYRYIHAFFKDVPNVLFGWSVNNESVPDIGTNSIAGYYPGSNYVDIVGVSGYNYGDPWQTFHDVFAPALYTFQIFQKPVMIFGMGSAEGERKAEWILDAINVQTKLYSEVIGWLWNNMPYDEKYNWRVESSPSSLDAFRKAIQK